MNNERLTMGNEYTNELKLDFGREGDQLIPVITQHYQNKKVLILSYVNKEAFEETLRSGYATYYSRKQKRNMEKRNDLRRFSKN